ncbi:MAG: hypothetical protein OER82_00850 [Nitrosopumilus sp.]|nr:hypothetical protein [Nitrosopumilus sp.]
MFKFLLISSFAGIITSCDVESKYSFARIITSCDVESDNSSGFSEGVVATSTPTTINTIIGIVFFLLIFIHS